MFACCLTEQDRRNKQIEDDLRKSKRKMRQTQKIVLLGVGESGKSTFLKQMQIIHGAGFNDQSKLEYRIQIYENVLKALSGLINGKNELKLIWSNQEVFEVFKLFRQIYKQLMDDRESEEKRLHRKIGIEPRQFTQAANLIKILWNEPSIQEAYARRREFPRFYVENIIYYIQNIDRISQLNYIPNAADILRCRRATTCIVEFEIPIKGVPFLFVDVGGQRTQRQKWQHCLSDATAILFLVSSNEYDEYLREDHHTNRLDESCKVFETLVNYRYLQDISFILFLNKYDLLKEKIRVCNIRQYCADFYGDPNSLDDVKRYLSSRFSRLKKGNDDYSTNGGTNSSGIYFNRNKSSKYAIDSTTNGAVAAANMYTHFTTAVDTDNIKVIFDMVKNMIFERNRQIIMLS